MKKATNKNLKFPAWGLLEMMIALGIFGVAIVSITAMNAKSFNKIKNNELIDQSNRIMVSAAEYWKSPVQTVQDQLSSNPGLTYYSLASTSSSINPEIDTRWDWVKSNNQIPLTNCTAGSEYQAKFITSAGADAFLFCVQVAAEKKSFGYQIISRISYTVGGENKSNLIIAYRPFTYVD